MKKLRTVAALIAFFACFPAFAQWQVQNGAIPVGRGGGSVGFSIVGGSAGAGAKCLIDSTPPTFGTCPATSPGGTSGQTQYNNAGSFGGYTPSGDCTVVPSTGVFTCLKTNGVAFGALATVVPGTGVVTALAINVGAAGAFVVNGGAGGTPSSLTLTNATGLPVAGGGTGLSSLTAGNLPCGAGTSPFASVPTNAGTTSLALISNGAATCPTYQLIGLASIGGLGTGVSTALGNAVNTAGGMVTVTSSNQVTRAMLAQGIARSVIGVAGNATANVADIQGTTANTFLGVNGAGNGLAFSTVPNAGLANSSTTVAGQTCTLGSTCSVASANLSDAGGWTTFTPTTPTCGSGSGTWGTLSGRFKTILGKTTLVVYSLALTTAGTCAGLVTVPLPNSLTAAAQNSYYLHGREIAGGVAVSGRIPSASTVVQIMSSGGNTPGIANGATYEMSGTFENQ